MAYRRHVVAARNTSPEAMGTALAGAKVSEIEHADGWCWAMASVWTTGAGELLEALSDFDGPLFVVTTEDGCRWRFHLRKKDEESFSTVHEFSWIRIEGSGDGQADDWQDVYEDESDSPMVEIGAPPPLPAQRLEPLPFVDEFFQPYMDDDDKEDDDEEAYEERTPLEEIAGYYSDDYGLSLPADLIANLEGLPREELYPRFLALHAVVIADALERFGIPHERDTVVQILTGKTVSRAEMDSDVGNLWRFLAHLGLGKQFEDALQEMESAGSGEPEEPWNPATAVLEAAGDLPLHAVEDGPAVLSVIDAPLLARVAACLDVHPEVAFRVFFDPCTGEWPADRPPSYAQFFPLPDGVSIFCSDAGTLQAVRARQRVGALFASLPAGARLELLTRGEYAKLRFSGTVQDGQWYLDGASVALAPSDIEGLLALFRASEAKAPQPARSADEADAVMALAARHMALYDDLPVREGLQLWSRKRAEANALAAILFRQRFRHRWDVEPIERHVGECFEEWQRFEREQEEENAPPVTDEVIFEGQASKFMAPDYRAKSIDEGMRMAIDKAKDRDREFRDLGFEYLGGLVCLKVGGAILRCYAHAGEQTYGIAYAASFGMAWLDLVTRFGDGTILTTTSSAMESSICSLRHLVRYCHADRVAQLHLDHREGIARLIERGMNPVPIDPSLQGIAAAMDEFLVRRLGSGGEEDE